MTERFTYRELADIHFIYGFCNGNAAEAVREYAQRYPGRRQPDRRTFIRTHHCLRDLGQLNARRREPGRRREAYEDERILAAVRDRPTISTRSVGRRLGVPHTRVWRLLHYEFLHPYHFTPVQTLSEEDKVLRRAYCEIMLLKEQEYPDFFSLVIWTDESQFTRDGVTNLRNLHFWSAQNPQCKKQMRSQHRFAHNVWMGIIGHTLLGPYIFPGTLTGTTYLEFLQNSFTDFLDESLPLSIYNNVFFQQDGAPPHFSRNVRAWLDDNYNNRWIGRGGPINWPPRSPDLTPLDFYVWGYMKSKVYEVEIHTAEQLHQRILNAADELRRNLGSVNLATEIRKRYTLCKTRQGDHIENVL